MVLCPKPANELDPELDPPELDPPELEPPPELDEDPEDELEELEADELDELELAELEDEAEELLVVEEDEAEDEDKDEPALDPDPSGPVRLSPPQPARGTRPARAVPPERMRRNSRRSSMESVDFEWRFFITLAVSHVQGARPMIHMSHLTNAARRVPQILRSLPARPRPFLEGLWRAG